mmetsp:Transcript_127635/g.369504  ORF Transcript_127635/g.369504 Transcript_127635/m.369504 type:complete len:94 (-) Transcript_127635:1457-1738(-)
MLMPGLHDVKQDAQCSFFSKHIAPGSAQHLEAEQLSDGSTGHLTGSVVALGVVVGSVVALGVVVLGMSVVFLSESRGSGTQDHGVLCSGGSSS